MQIGSHFTFNHIYCPEKDNSTFLQKLYIFVTSTESPGSSQASRSVAGYQETDSGEQHQIFCTKETCKKWKPVNAMYTFFIKFKSTSTVQLLTSSEVLTAGINTCTGPATCILK